MKVIKSNTYNIINPEPFEIPFPLVFELLSGNTLLAEYSISETGTVDYSFNPDTSEKILTSIRRPLTLHDIYFLFTTRIFPDKTPFTAMEMERFGIEEYHPYAIMRKTHGILPGDKYWFRFDNENINHKLALREYQAYYENSYKRYIESLESAQKEQNESPGTTETDSDKEKFEEILSVNEKMPDEVVATLFSHTQPMNVSGEDMSDDDIAALLAHTQEAVGIPKSESGNQPAPASSSEKMSDDAIAAMLAQAQTAEPEPASSNEKMSDDAIAAMLAQAQTAEPAPASSNEKMSDDAIAAMFAQNQ